MLDIHTHLYWESYDADRDQVVERARAAGVREMLVVGCTVDESRQAVELASRYPDMYAVVGIHPHELNLESGISNLESWLKELRKLAQEERVIAIGECGLDYFSHDAGTAITEEQKKNQKAGFLAQIALAQELHLPLIIHCRTNPGQSDAYEDILSILQATSYKLPAVLHCYMGDTEVTKRFLSLPNVYFSFTGNITYPVKKMFAGTKDDLGETVKLVPLERLFVETDCPFLSPQGKRGERNEPSFVTLTAEKVCALKDISPLALDTALDQNFQKVFKK